MEKPNLKALMKLVEINKKIEQLYKIKSDTFEKIFDKYGEGTYPYELENETEEGKKFMKFSIQSVINKKERGEDVYIHSYVPDFETKFTYAKGKYKELK